MNPIQPPGSQPKVRDTITIDCPKYDDQTQLPQIPSTSFTVCGSITPFISGGYILLAFVCADGAKRYSSVIPVDKNGKWCGQITLPTGCTGGDLLVYFSQTDPTNGRDPNQHDPFPDQRQTPPNAVLPGFVVDESATDPCSECCKCQ